MRRQPATPDYDTGAHVIEARDITIDELEATAAELGISKTTLWRRMKQYGIRDRFEG